MAAPPVPPRPYEASSSESNFTNPGPPPPLPPLPPSLRFETERYNTPSPYEFEQVESPPRFEHPMIAPRPHRVDASIPVNMARTLDEQVYTQQGPIGAINYTPGFVIPATTTPQQQWMMQTYQAPPVDITASLANLAMSPSNSYPASPNPHPPVLRHSTKPPSPPRTAETGLPALTAPLPQLPQLQAASSQVQSPAHDPSLKIAWCRDVFVLVQRARPGTGPTPPTDPPVGPVQITDPILESLAGIAVQIVLQLAASWTPPPQGQQPGAKMPPHVAEAIAMRAILSATGAFPQHVRHHPRTAFRDFETAARGGYAGAWFRLGRDYENFNDLVHAKECFERGAKLGVEGCLYRIGMAHLLGQLGLPANPTTALPLLHRAALLASLQTPQPAYVYALLLLAEFTQLPQPLPPSLFASLSLIPQGSSPSLEARKHLERAAFLHFPAAQYKLGHAYEFAEPPFGWDPVLSVRYYSLASEGGESEADMALSKWFLCGSHGGGMSLANASSSTGSFEKDEGLALTFSAKAARKGLPSAEFAMGYYAEVGVGQPRDADKATGWYLKAQAHGNPDAPARLLALTQPQPHLLSRQEHDTLTESQLVRRRTQAAQRAETQPLSPPWEGQVFPSAREWEEGNPQSVGQVLGQGQGQGQVQGQGAGRGQGRRRREDGRTVVDVIRKNSLATGYAPASTTPSGVPVRGRMPTGLEQSPQRYDSSTGSPPQQRTSPNRRTQSPGRNTPGSGRATPQGTAAPAQGATSTQPPSGRGKLERMRLNLEDPGVSSSSLSSLSAQGTSGRLTAGTPAGGGKPADTPLPPMGVMNTPKPAQGAQQAATQSGGKTAQTFADMGIHGAKAQDKECVIM